MTDMNGQTDDLGECDTTVDEFDAMWDDAAPTDIERSVATTLGTLQVFSLPTVSLGRAHVAGPQYATNTEQGDLVGTA